MRTHYLTPGLLMLFLLMAVGWFIWHPSSEETPGEPAARVASQGAEAGPAARRGRPIADGGSSLLAMHEPGVSFTPDGENVAPSFHVEMQALNKRLEETPQDTTALIRLARLKQDGHQTEEAVAYYRRYLAVRPEGRQAWLDLTRCYGELARWDEALETTQSMLRHFPDEPAALYNLGAIYANTNRPDEARAAWEQAARQDRNPEMKTMAENALKRLATAHP